MKKKNFLLLNWSVLKNFFSVVIINMVPIKKYENLNEACAICKQTKERKKKRKIINEVSFHMKRKKQMRTQKREKKTKTFLHMQNLRCRFFWWITIFKGEASVANVEA